MIAGAVESFIRSLLVPALTPLLDAVGSALLSTPTPSELPALVGLWEGSRVLAVSLYGLLVMAGGLIVMGHQTVQTRYTVHEVAPRLLLGFLASMFSLAIAEQATIFSNAMADAILGDAVTADSATDAMTEMVTGAVSGSAGLWVIVVALCIPVLLVALLITYVIRVALAAILLVAAPLLLIFHTLPQTEGVARWWWRAYAAVLAAQIGQSLTLAVGLRVILTPGGLILAEDAGQAWLGILVLIALLGIMIKIPFWLMAATRIGGPSLLRIAGRALQVYAGLRSPRGAAAGPRAVGRAGRRRPGPGGPAGSGPGRGPRWPRGGPGGPLGSPVRPPSGPRGGPTGGPRGGPRPVGPRSAGGAGVPDRPRHVGEGFAPANADSAGTAVPLRHGRYQLPQPRPHTPGVRPAITAAAPPPPTATTTRSQTGAADPSAPHERLSARAAATHPAPAGPIAPTPSAHPYERVLPGATARGGATPRTGPRSRPGPRPASRPVAPTPPRPVPTRPTPRAPGGFIPPTAPRPAAAPPPRRRPAPPQAPAAVPTPPVASPASSASAPARTSPAARGARPRQHTRPAGPARASRADRSGRTDQPGRRPSRRKP
jgi:hypothetical protein